MSVLERLTAIATAAFVARSIGIALRSSVSVQPTQPQPELPMLSIVVPARNEERQIEACVSSLLAQRYPAFEVIVVDDRSTDGTPEILARMALREPRLTLVAGKELPPGWIGKSWALVQGAEKARGTWLLFTDADTLHEPNAAASAISFALRSGTQIVSLLPRQRFETRAERIVLPTILWLIAFAVGSLEAINDLRRTATAIFNGQFLLFERSAYQSLGGHAAVRNAIAEDYELARLVKRDGRFRSVLAGAAPLLSTRMYRSLSEIWQGFTKNLYVAAADEPVRAILGLAMLAAISPLAHALLLGALLRRDFRAALRMSAFIGATIAAAEFGMRRSAFPRMSGAYFPIGAAVTLAIFVNSAAAHRMGRVRWRGRTYGGRG